MTEGTPVKTTRTFTNRALICVDCKEEFAFPVSAQEYFAEKEWPDPKRCRSCHTEHKLKHPKEKRKPQEGSFGLPPGGEHLLNLNFE